MRTRTMTIENKLGSCATCSSETYLRCIGCKQPRCPYCDICTYCIRPEQSSSLSIDDACKAMLEAIFTGELDDFHHYASILHIEMEQWKHPHSIPDLTTAIKFLTSMQQENPNGEQN